MFKECSAKMKVFYILYRQVKLFIISAIIAISLLACGGGGGASNPIQSPASSKTLQQVLDDSVDSGLDGIIVYAELANQEPILRSAGVRNRVTFQAADANALFKIASISKLFVAVTATKLVHQNMLQLDDTLAFWLPDLASRIANSDTITVQQMLQHRSGIPDFDSQVGFSWQNPHTDADTTLEFALDLAADFSPNERFEYSNTNYLLLGKVLDAALGYSHRTFIRDSIITPLGLTDTYTSADDIDLALLMKGYWENQDRSEQGYDITGGSMVSTVRDTGVFLRELNSTSTLFTEEEKATYDTVYFNQHTGWLPGYQSIARYQAELNAIIIVFVNETGDNSESILASTYDEIVEVL